MQRRIVELELRQRVAEVFVVFRLHREQAGEYARLHLLEAGERLARGPCIERDGVANRRTIDLPDTGDHEAHLAGLERLARQRLRREAAELVDLMRAAGRPHTDLL